MALAMQSADSQLALALRGHLVEICSATAFLVAGLTSCAIASIRRRSGVRVFLWLGIWSAAYGVQHLLGVPAVIFASPRWLQVSAPYIQTSITYLLVVVGATAWLDLLVGAMRRVVLAIIILALVTAVLGISWFVATGVAEKFMPLNNLLAACVLAILISAVTSKRLFRKYLVLPERGFLVFGTFVFAIEALYANVARPFGYSLPILFDHLCFAVLLIAFGHSALRMVLNNEHRLLAIDSELDIAREIQSSLLTSEVPKVHNVEIVATYHPMTAVAGDFYEFLPVDDQHAGFLVADVCGHGVPAALIASMLKVAVQSVAAEANSPSRFLSSLNRVLAAPLRGQLVSAAYLWIDMKARKALYSAAGHPPLLRSNHHLESFESNGLLFGVLPDAAYPVRELPLTKGDRFLLYTDGISEPENAAGEAFGEKRLAQVLQQHQSLPTADLSHRILTEIETWQRSSEPRDDMTLIVIDVD